MLDQLATGASVDEVVAVFPYLERDDLLSALEFAAEAAEERELPLASSL